MRHKTDDFWSLLEKYFETYLPVSKGLSPATIKSYKSTFRLLIEFMNTVKGVAPSKIQFSVLDSQTISEFLNWLETDRKCSISTRNQRLSAIAAFAEYAQNHNFDVGAAFKRDVLKIPKKRIPCSKRSYFTRDEIKILLELPLMHKATGLRDKTLLCFMYASGMRAQEVCDMTVGDVQFYEDRARIKVHGKGQKIRLIGIPASMSEMLKKYIEYRGLTSSPEKHVFSSQTHEKMTVSCVEEIYSKYVRIAKLKYPEMFRENYTPHSMRHTTATHMLEAGVPLIVLKNFLGHVSLQTTQIYAEVTQDTMNNKLKAWNESWFLKDSADGSPLKQKDELPEFLL